MLVVTIADNTYLEQDWMMVYIIAAKQIDILFGFLFYFAKEMYYVGCFFSLFFFRRIRKIARSDY